MTRKTKQWLGVFLLTLAALFYVVRGYKDQTKLWFSSDFKPVYGGARCLLQHCNPYNSDHILARYLEAGGDPQHLNSFHANYANYPPSALFLAMPFAVLPWPVAHVLWLAASSATFLLACYLMADLCRDYSPLRSVSALALMVLTSTMLVMLAQPAAPTIGLAAIGVWCLLRQRFVIPGMVCFAISLSFKPHLAGLVLLYFFLSSAQHRRQALGVLGLSALISLPGLLWATNMPESAHWLADLKHNLQAVAAPGELSDPGPRNAQRSSIISFQTVVSNFRDEPAFYNLVTYSFIGGLIAAWLYPALRMRPSLEKHLLAIGSIACLSLLPIYHRQYDSRLLILLMPALAVVLHLAPRRGLLTLAATVVFVITSSHSFDSFLSSHYIQHHPQMGFWEGMLVGQHICLSLVLLSMLYLAEFYAAASASRSPARIEEPVFA